MIERGKPEPGTEVLTWEEIKERYPDQYVVIDDPELNEDLEVLSGKVIAHGTNRHEVHSQADGRHGGRVAFKYTGTHRMDYRAWVSES